MSDVCLLGAMDYLWFHQVVLFPEASSHVVSLKDIKAPQPSSESRQTSSKTSDLSLLDQETSSELFSNIASQEDSNNEEDEQDKEKAGRPTTTRASSSNLKKTKRRSQSLSPSLQKGSHRSTLAYSSSTEGLQNMNNVVVRGRSLCELELEEVKGFMDLGFVFKKENMSPKMVSLVPGLQRLNAEITTDKDDEVEEEVDDQEDSIRRRPYLSESWLIKRPDSPLLNLRVPRNYAAGNMKKHLRSWARTVASEIQQVY